MTIEIQAGFPRFHAADIEEIGQNFVESVAVLAGREQKFHLFFGNGADLFLEKEVNRHADGRERRLELMGDRSDHIRFQFVHLAELSDVLKDEDDALRPLLEITG